MRSKLPEGWKEAKIETLIDLQIDNRGRNPSEYFDFADYPVIDNHLIRNTKYPNMLNVKRYIDKKTFDAFLRGYVKKDDVLITLVGNGIGNVTMVPYSNSVIIQNTLGLRTNKNIMNFYLYYLLLYKQEEIRNFDRGSSQPSIRKTDLFKLRVAFPTLEEQKAIAATLSALDDKIELNNKTNENLEAQAQALFKHWFVDFEFPDENGNSYKSSGGAMVESEEGMIPEGWEIGKLIDEIGVIYGFPFKSKLFNEDKKGYPLIRIRDLKTNEPQHYTAEDHPKKEFVNSGDVLAGMDGDFTPYIWLGNKGVLNQRVCKFHSLYPFKYDNLHIYLLIQPKLRVIESYKVGTTVIHLGKTDIDKIEIVIPDTVILEKFKLMTNSILREIINNAKQNQTLSQLRDTLLPKLMSGQIRIPLED